MVRLHTTAAMASIGVNHCNLWSLSRGFSREKINLFNYQMNLQDADNFTDESLADFVRFCLEQCLDQISFISRLLDITTIESRIEQYLKNKLPQIASIFPGGDELAKVLKREGVIRLLWIVFRSGKMRRGDAYELLGVQRKRGGEIIKLLLKHELLRSTSDRGPLLFGFPEEAMPDYFPYLYKPSLMVDPGETAQGVIVKDGDEIKVAMEDGSLRTIGAWSPSMDYMLGKQADPEIVWRLIRVQPYTGGPKTCP
jgi:hypothetical protein